MDDFASSVMSLVDEWTTKYINELGPVDERYTRLLRSAFKSGCMTVVTEFAKAEAKALVDKHMKKEQDNK